MDKISKKSLLGLAIYVAGFALIILFLLNPTLAEIEKSKQKIIEEQKQLAANYDEIASLQKIEKDKEGFEEIKNTVFGYLPATLNSSQFIVEVEGLAKKTDITIDSVAMNSASSSISTKKETTESTSDTGKTEASKKKAKNGTQQNQFTLTIKADFVKTMTFIQQMEKLSRYNSVIAISLVSVEGGNTSVAITGNIFYEQ